MVRYKNANEFLIDYLNFRTDEDRPLSKHLEIAFEAGKNSIPIEPPVMPNEVLAGGGDLVELLEKAIDTLNGFNLKKEGNTTIGRYYVEQAVKRIMDAEALTHSLIVQYCELESQREA